jgi:hypothetical protein
MKIYISHSDLRLISSPLSHHILADAVPAFRAELDQRHPRGERIAEMVFSALDLGIDQGCRGRNVEMISRQSRFHHSFAETIPVNLSFPRIPGSDLLAQGLNVQQSSLRDYAMPRLD